RTARIVSNQTLKHFYQWSINTGPQMIDDQDMWTEVYDAIEKNDISEAAARLRNGLERFFEMICNALQAPVPYTSSHRWDFGVFRSAAIGKYRNLLKEAKKALQSWGKDKQDQFMAVQQLEERVSQAAIQAGEESWGINSNVHFNEWSNFSKNDFLPVVNAYKELCATFLCPSCGQPIRGIGGGLNPERIQCACDKMGWSMNKNRTVKKLAG
ncbi:MAG: hypothetical protein KDD15_33980, partial [Lewinella sp.]|nr:hypothetical protein [Lewinella sp.]